MFKKDKTSLHWDNEVFNKVESTELQSNLLYQDFKKLHQVFLELETEREMDRIRALEK